MHTGDFLSSKFSHKPNMIKNLTTAVLSVLLITSLHFHCFVSRVSDLYKSD